MDNKNFITGLFSILIATSHCFGQTTTLPPAAQEAINKGIVAAKIPDYPLAVNYFQEARKTSPQSAEIFFNLGLAESNIPGRELRAICWFGAYLSVTPAAPNAVAVKEQIDMLDVISQSNISRFLKTVQDAAIQLSDDNHNQSSDLHAVSKLWLEFGDTESAQKTTNLIQASSWKSSSLYFIAEAKIKAGDLAGAKTTLAAALKTAELINTEPSFGIQSSEFVKMDIQEALAILQAKSGDIAGALKTADFIKEISHKCRAQRMIAKALMEIGDNAGAKKSLMAAQKSADLIQDGELKNYVTSDIAEAQIKTDIINVPTTTRILTPGIQPQIHPLITVSDWIKKLDDDNMSNDCALNTGYFLDLADYLKSMPPSNDPKNIFKGLHDTAGKIIKAQIIIEKMMKEIK